MANREVIEENMKANEVAFQKVTGAIQYKLTNDYMFRAVLQCFLQALFGQSCKIFLDIVACPFWTKLQSLTSLC